MKVRLTRKLTAVVDGVDLTNYAVGDVIDMPPRKGRLLIAEGWAVEERRVGGASRVLAFRRRASDVAPHAGLVVAGPPDGLVSRAASRSLSG